ncbi:MAG: hypothetical protein M0Z41_05395 [Peptococcaceae bacterium]|jgi:hypothetical protein|nr:hypothetical protein [Peptococcaceae bacterium]
MVGKVRMVVSVAFLLAVFLLAYRVFPVRLEEEHVRALAGALASKVIIVDGAYGGYGEDGSQTAGKLVDWLGQAGAMVVLSGDADPSLDYPPEGATGLAAVLRSAGPADLLVSVRPGVHERITYSAGEEELARDIRREMALVQTGAPELAAEPGSSTAAPWVEVETGPLDARGEDNLAWAVYAGVARYFAAQPPAVNGRTLETLENDIPSTVDSR